jgi:hypothetical protein
MSVAKVVVEPGGLCGAAFHSCSETYVRNYSFRGNFESFYCLCYNFPNYNIDFLLNLPKRFPEMILCIFGSL